MESQIKESDFIFEWFSGTGGGGQHRNKHQNCCRCIHVPTGIKANGTSSRSRDDNKKTAYSVCLARVKASFHQDKERFLAGNERIRTYHEADNRVVDHSSGLTMTWNEVIIKDGFDEMVNARAKSIR